jgi:hypothetical protein
MKHLFKSLPLLLLAVALLVSLSGCGNAELEAENQALRQELSAVMEENALLREQIVSLQYQLDQWNQASGLSDFGAEFTAWDTGDGATVTVTATPVAYTEGQSADLVVWLNGVEVEKLPFHWDGSRYTAVAELKAADGYTFLCVLHFPDGTTQEIVLDSPEMDALVFLESNLTAFLNLVVQDWIVENDTLILEAGYAYVQLPRVSSSLAITRAELRLNLNGQELQRQNLTLVPVADGSGWEQVLVGTAFPLPELAEEDQLDLWLEAELSDGQQLSVTGGSWFLTDGELIMAVG